MGVAKQFFEDCLEKSHQLLCAGVDGKDLTKMIEFALYKHEEDEEMYKCGNSAYGCGNSA